MGTTVVSSLADIDLVQMRTEESNQSVSVKGVLMANVKAAQIDTLPRLIELFGRNIGSDETNRIYQEACILEDKEEEAFISRLKDEGFIEEVDDI